MIEKTLTVLIRGSLVSYFDSESAQNDRKRYSQLQHNRTLLDLRITF